ncbi:hypothetical protein Dimus_028705 [Dionaea muscipula]
MTAILIKEGVDNAMDLTTIGVDRTNAEWKKMDKQAWASIRLALSTTAVGVPLWLCGGGFVLVQRFVCENLCQGGDLLRCGTISSSTAAVQLAS